MGPVVLSPAPFSYLPLDKEDKMEKQTLIDSLRQGRSDTQKLTVVWKLKDYLSDVDVIRALCLESIQTDSHQLRVAIIDALKSKKDFVNPYFAHMAVNARYATMRKWALVNLSLMECKSAKMAVVNGLRDACGTVQHAAALNIGLYHDTEFLIEVKRFFERNSFGCSQFKYTSQKGNSACSNRHHGSYLLP